MPPIEENSKISIEALTVHLSYIRNDLAEIKNQLASLKDLYVTKTEFRVVAENYVSKKEFAVVQKIVYGVVTLILTSVIVAGLNALFK